MIIGYEVRVRVAPAWQPSPVEYRQVSGGLLVQTVDRIDAKGDDESSWRLVAGIPVSADVLADLSFAWRAVRSVKSNAIEDLVWRHIIPTRCSRSP